MTFLPRWQRWKRKIPYKRFRPTHQSRRKLSKKRGILSTEEEMAKNRNHDLKEQKRKRRAKEKRDKRVQSKEGQRRTQ